MQIIKLISAGMFLMLSCTSKTPVETETPAPEKPTVTPEKEETKPEQGQENPLKTEIVGAWKHHQEQDAEQGVQVWVRNQDLPAARFRGAMSFKDDGSCTVRVLHPADAHYHAPCSYTISGSYLSFEYTKTHNNTKVQKKYRAYIKDDELRLSSEEKN